MYKKLMDVFVNSTESILKEMADIDIIKKSPPFTIEEDFNSLGVSSTITFAGNNSTKGRFIIDISESLTLEIVKNILSQNVYNIKERLALSCISEMNNTIAGDANTYINNNFKLGLRLAPPIVFAGKNIKVANAKLESVNVVCETSFGNMNVNIGFTGGEVI